jgi:hypothetical protein
MRREREPSYSGLVFALFVVVGTSSGFACTGDPADSVILAAGSAGSPAGPGGQPGGGGGGGTGGAGGNGGSARGGTGGGATGTSGADAGNPSEDSGGNAADTGATGGDGSSTFLDAISTDADAGGTDIGSSSDVRVEVDGGSDRNGPTTRPPCLAKPSQVALIGDSYINWVSHTFPADLAREASVTYRLYAVGAAAMGSGGLGLIPPQLDQAVAADPDIIALVMDGGGNDILVPDTLQFPQGNECRNSASSPTIPDCQKIVQKALDTAVALMLSAADKGIKDVVYFYYPHVPEGTLIGGLHPNELLDYALPMVKATCDEAYVKSGGRLTCHFHMIPVFENHPDWFAFTDIHPNTVGSAAMAKAVWSLMRQKCIAQPASSGCCAP